jgi:hypothetical protein
MFKYFLPQKLLLSSQNMGWRSRIRKKKLNQDSGVKKAPDPRSATLLFLNAEMGVGQHLEPVCEEVVGQHIHGEGHLVAVLALLEPACRIHDIFVCIRIHDILVWIRIRIRILLFFRH